MLIPLKFGKSQFLANLVIANAQRLNLLVRYMNLFSGLEIHAVDNTVRVNVFAVGVGADKDFTALEVSGKLPRRFMGRARVDVCTFWKTLYHVVKHHAAVFMVQQLRTQEFVERRFRLATDPADELLTVPKRLAELGNIAHDTFHAAACLCAFLVVYEMDDCDFPHPPSCICRRVTLIFANSCAAVSRLAN